MPAVNPGDVWLIDFGMTAKVRPALSLTGEPADDELDLVTVLLHATALRGNRWELTIPKPFLKPGAFHLQQIQMVSTVKLERRLGVLTGDEMDRVRDALANRLGIVGTEQKTTK
jgi:mRNA interferase MazF